MDVTGTTQAAMGLERAQAAGDEARVRALGQRPAPHTREDLAKTAREFESVFLDILMRSMRNTVPEGELMGGGGGTRIYRQLYDSEMARTIASSGGGLGIARLLEEQFADDVAPDPDPGSVISSDDRKLPSPLALERYRQASAPGVTAAPALNAETPAPSRSIHWPPPAPLPPPETVRPIPAPPVTAPAVEAAMSSADRRADDSPGRLGLAPADRRLAGAPLRTAEADTVRRFGADIDRAAATAGLDPRLVLAVVMEESGGDPAARSQTGARGLMQLMPGTARDLGVANAADPAANLSGGARYLAAQLDRFEGRLDLALAAYNAGPGNVERAGRRIPGFTETRRYVERVMDRYERLRGGTELDTGKR